MFCSYTTVWYIRWNVIFIWQLVTQNEFQFIRFFTEGEWTQIKCQHLHGQNEAQNICVVLHCMSHFVCILGGQNLNNGEGSTLLMYMYRYLRERGSNLDCMHQFYYTSCDSACIYAWESYYIWWTYKYPMNINRIWPHDLDFTYIHLQISIYIRLVITACSDMNVHVACCFIHV